MRRNWLAQISWSRYRYTDNIYLCNLFIAFNALISLFCFCVSFSCFLFSFSCFIIFSVLIYENCFGLKVGGGGG